MPDDTRPFLPRNSAAIPSMRPDYSPEALARWLKRHEEYAALARSGGFDAVFFGDSLTEAWGTIGKASWAWLTAPFHAANFGLSGDRTQQVLWRLLNGELEGLQPKLVVLLIGTNNLDPGLGENSPTPQNTTPEIISGIGTIVDTLRSRLSTAHILLHGLFPRGRSHTPIRDQIREINVGLRRLARERGSITYIDVGPKFLAAEDALNPVFQPDLLHLNESGYAIWAEVLHPALAELLPAIDAR